MEKKAIKQIFWPNDQGHLTSNEETGQLYQINEFHGDWDHDWIIVEKDGREVQRHNPRYIESIIWEE